MKKNVILSVLLVLCMLLSFPFSANAESTAASGRCGENATWSYDADSKTLTIGGSGPINNYANNTQPWKNYRDSILKIEIGDGITSVGNYDFYLFKSLTEVKFPESLVFIADYAFHGCVELESVTFPENSQLTAIEDYAFDGCTSLSSVSFPVGSKLQSIGQYAFRKCTNLSGLDFSSLASLACILDNAFDGCTKLTELILPENSVLVSIGGSAFNGCTSLKRVVLPETLTDVGPSAFVGCSIDLLALRSSSLNVDYNSLGSSGPKVIIACPGLMVKYKDEESVNASSYFQEKVVNASVVWTHFDNDGNQVCDVCESSFNPIQSADMSLSSSIAMNYYAATALSSGKMTMDFSIGSVKEQNVTAISTGKENEVSFKFSNIGPQYMTDNITAELYYDGVKIAEKNTVSVCSYLTKVSETSDYTDNDKLKSLVSDLVEYGAAAQQYRQYKADNLANSILNGNKTTFVRIDSTDKVLGNKINDNVYLSAAGVNYGDTNRIYVKFKTDNLSGTTVTIDGAAATPEEISEGTYIVYTDGIAATDYNTVHTFVLSFGTGTQSCTYSVKSYVYSMQAKDDTNAYLAKAMYNYGLSAIAYKASLSNQ